jgi:hypothetical protein
VFLTSRGIRRRLADTYQSTKRFVDAKAVEIHGGYQAIFVNEIPVVADDDVPKGSSSPSARSAFKWFQVDDPDWLKSEDGTVWQLAAGSVAGTRRAAWQAWFVWYAALGAWRPTRSAPSRTRRRRRDRLLKRWGWCVTSTCRHPTRCRPRR